MGVSGHSKSDFGDIRFTSSDGATLLSHWMESKTDSDEAAFWVKVPDDLSSASRTIYVYYGNGDATTSSNGENTFPFFDDFSGSSLDMTKWTVAQGNTPTVANGEVTLVGNPNCTIESQPPFGTGYAVRARSRAPSNLGWVSGFSDIGLSSNWIIWDATASYDNWISVCSRDGTEQILESSITKNAQYHIFEVRRISSSLVKMYYNDLWQLDHSDSTYIPTINLPVVLRSFGDGVALISHWVLVRKCVDPEPSHGAWGKEETAPSAKLYIDPSTVTKSPVNVGENFTVSAKIQGVTDLFGFDIKITWDNALITFLSLNSTSLNSMWPQGHFEPLPAPGCQTGVGYVRYAAVATGKPGFTGSGTLFNITFQIVKAWNSSLSTSIHFDTVELGDSHWSAISAALTDGQYNMGATVQGLEFDLVNPYPSKPFEYCKYFEVQVYATDIWAHLTNYDLKIDYDSELLTFAKVQEWGVFGTGYVDNGTTGIVHIWNDPNSTPYVGNKGLLFTLTFHIEFGDTIGHIWRTSNLGPLAAQISLDTTYCKLSFQEGDVLIGQVITPSPLTIPINLIQGDVTCDGQVDIGDLRTVAAFYNRAATPSSPSEKYDLKTDGTIDIYDLVLAVANFGYDIPDNPP
jgi:hypothetical protein